MKDSRPAIFTPLVILGAGLIASLLMVGLLLSLAWLHPSPVQRPMGTAIINIIVASTNTSAPPIILPTETPDPTPTKVSAETLPQGEIAIGSYVQVTGTGTTGLRIRAQPGLQGEVRFLGIEAEVFRIIDGPRQADDYTWWHLQAPYDESLHGWAVADFLSVIQR